MQALTTLKRTDAYRRSGHTYRNAIAHLFMTAPERYLANVFLEAELCISCFYEVGISTLPLHDHSHLANTAHSAAWSGQTANHAGLPALVLCQFAANDASALCKMVCQAGAVLLSQHTYLQRTQQAGQVLPQGADLEAPTMFITHFTGAPHCNDFSLASDDPSVPPFNSKFVEHYRLGRCKLTQVRGPLRT